MRGFNKSSELLALDQPGQDSIGRELRFDNIGASIRALSPGKLASSAFAGLKPEILHRRKTDNHRPLSSTAWLNGLRGWAALIVCFGHLHVYTHLGSELCYGHEISEGVYNNTPAAWPFIRIFFSGGHFCVMVFFIISGYVLTPKLITLLHEGRQDDFVDALHSSVFRRPVRLYLPVILSTLFFLFFWHVTGIAIPWPAKEPNIFLELAAWCKDIMKFLYFYRIGLLFTYYNIHTWTIPVELRGSMFIFIWLFALHRFSNRIRILMTTAMTFYLAVGTPGAWFAGFFAGMLTVELDLLGQEGSLTQIKLPWTRFFKGLNRRRILRGLLLHVMLVCALFLAGEPTSDSMEKEEFLGNCPGWRTLSKLIPPAYNAEHEALGGERKSTCRWFWLFWAAWMLLVSIKEIGWARRIFETSFSQYLGKHSFALYLIHGPIIGILSERLFYLTGLKAPITDDDRARFGHLHNRWHDASWWPFSDHGPLGLEPNFLFSAFLSIIVFLYVAELGTKLFDVPGIHFSKWVYVKLKGMR